MRSVVSESTVATAAANKRRVACQPKLAFQPKLVRAKADGGEGGNRTHSQARSAGATILKTATTTRHVSLSTAHPTVRREAPGLDHSYTRRSGFDLPDDRGAMKAVGPETVEHLVH